MRIIHYCRVGDGQRTVCGHFDSENDYKMSFSFIGIDYSQYDARACEACVLLAAVQDKS